MLELLLEVELLRGGCADGVQVSVQVRVFGVGLQVLVWRRWWRQLGGGFLVEMMEVEMMEVVFLLLPPSFLLLLIVMLKMGLLLAILAGCQRLVLSLFVFVLVHQAAVVHSPCSLSP